MADPPPDADTGAVPDHGATTGTPRWVKVLGIIAAVVALLVVINVLGFRGGGHGPGGQMPPPSVTPGGVPPP